MLARWLVRPSVRPCGSADGARGRRAAEKEKRGKAVCGWRRSTRLFPLNPLATSRPLTSLVCCPCLSVDRLVVCGRGTWDVGEEEHASAPFDRQRQRVACENRSQWGTDSYVAVYLFFFFFFFFFFCLIILAFDLYRSWRRTFCPVFSCLGMCRVEWSGEQWTPVPSPVGCNAGSGAPSEAARRSFVSPLNWQWMAEHEDAPRALCRSLRSTRHDLSALAHLPSPMSAAGGGRERQPVRAAAAYAAMPFAAAMRPLFQ